MIQTVDFFPPIVDDPFAFGQIAAANAISDVYAMGGTPKLAMNLLCMPNCLSPEQVEGILQGGYQKAAEAGIVIAGGHTIEDVEPKYGMCVTGFAKPSEILTNGGAKVGDLLVLTKPLGVGVLSTASMAELLDPAGYQEMIRYMTMLNAAAKDVMMRHNPHSCTDVTGFGLIGHAQEMAATSGLTLLIDAKRVPLLPQALAFARDGIVPEGAYRNMHFLEQKVSLDAKVEEAVADLLYDPQTSGGLLVAVSEADANVFCTEYPEAAIIGEVTEKQQTDLVVE